VKQYLGIDYGTKRIGLALGDDLTKVVTPFGVVSSIADIVDVLEREPVDQIVVGLPKSMHGESGAMQAQVEQFVCELGLATGVPIDVIDERLSSKAGDALGKTKDSVQKKMRQAKASRDAIAAMLILQSYLDRQSYGGNV